MLESVTEKLCYRMQWPIQEGAGLDFVDGAPMQVVFGADDDDETSVLLTGYFWHKDTIAGAMLSVGFESAEWQDEIILDTPEAKAWFDSVKVDDRMLACSQVTLWLVSQPGPKPNFNLWWRKGLGFGSTRLGQNPDPIVGIAGTRHRSLGHLPHAFLYLCRIRTGHWQNRRTNRISTNLSQFPSHAHGQNGQNGAQVRTTTLSSCSSKTASSVFSPFFFLFSTAEPTQLAPWHT